MKKSIDVKGLNKQSSVLISSCASVLILFLIIYITFTYMSKGTYSYVESINESETNYASWEKTVDSTSVVGNSTITITPTSEPIELPPEKPTPESDDPVSPTATLPPRISGTPSSTVTQKPAVSVSPTITTTPEVTVGPTVSVSPTDVDVNPSTGQTVFIVACFILGIGAIGYSFYYIKHLNSLNK